MTTVPDRPPKPRATRAQLLRKLASVEGEPYIYQFVFEHSSTDLDIYAGDDPDAAAQWATLFKLPEAQPEEDEPHETGYGRRSRTWSSLGEWRGWKIRVWHFRREPAPAPAAPSTVVMERLDAELAEHQDEHAREREATA